MIKLEIDWKKLEDKIRKLLVILRPFKQFSKPAFKIIVIIGGFIAYSLIYLLKGGENPITPQDLGYQLAYMIPTSGLVLIAQLLFKIK